MGYVFLIIPCLLLSLFQYISVRFMEIRVPKNPYHCVQRIDDFAYFRLYFLAMAERF